MNAYNVSSSSRRTPSPAWRLLLVSGIALLGLATGATAAVRYVSPTGGGNGTQASPWSLAQANASAGLQAGDTARLMTGTYTNQQIAPVNNGSSGLPITYIKDTGTVTLTGSPSGQPQVQLTNKSWIVVDGITLTDSTASSVTAISSTHCTVQNCTISRAGAWAGIGIGTFPPTIPTTYMTIKNCTFTDSNYNGSTGGVRGDHIYHVYSSYTLIENCTFGKAPHQGINLQRGSSFVIVKNCTVTNTWHTNVEAFTNDTENGGPAEGLTNIVYQDNLLYDNGIDHANSPTPEPNQTGLELEVSNGIFRRNIIHRTDPYGTNSIYTDVGQGLTCWGGQSSIGNRLYNNIIAGHTRGLYLDGTSGNVIQNNVWKNNIFYLNTQNDVATGNIGGTIATALQSTLLAFNNFYSPGINSNYRGTSGTIATIQSAFPSEWQNNLTLNPQFTNVGARNFALLSGSPMIDAGDFLTTTTGFGTNLSTVPVNDARYFHNGYGITTGDMVVVGSNAAKLVTAVNYTSTPNTLTLASPITWSTGAKVSLPYSGTKPDMGAIEYTGASAPLAPTLNTATPASSSQINLAWTDNSNNETGFEVDRATNSTFTTGPSPITNAYTAGANATGVSATGLSANTLYYFRVRATNGLDSPNSVTRSATTQAGGSPVVLDANALTIAGTSGETTDTLTFTGASNGNYLRFNGNGVGDYISFTVNQSGTYTISVRYFKNPWQGITQLSIDGTNQGSTFDGYAASGALATVSLGSKTLAAGNHTFRFQSTGKNASSQNYQISIDTITLTP